MKENDVIPFIIYSVVICGLYVISVHITGSPVNASIIFCTGIIIACMAEYNSSDRIQRIGYDLTCLYKKNINKLIGGNMVEGEIINKSRVVFLLSLCVIVMVVFGSIIYTSYLSPPQTNNIIITPILYVWHTIIPAILFIFSLFSCIVCISELFSD